MRRFRHARHHRFFRFAVFCLAAMAVPWCKECPATASAADFRDLIEADWTAQEKRRGRSADSPEALADALARGQRLVAHLASLKPAPDLRKDEAELARLSRAGQRAGSLGSADRLALYRKARGLVRRMALKNPRWADRAIAFLKRRRFISQMLHEYLGYFYDYGDVAGGGVFVLEEPGKSFRTRDLVEGRLPRGNYTTLAASFDARTLYFAFAERAPRKPEYDSPERRCFHLYSIDVASGRLRQLTEGPDDDFDPCPLPDGALAFMSTRRGGFGRCHNPWEPLPAYTLHRLEPDGRVRTLSFHETNEWHPSVLADGRIVYTRWDYVDRSAANYHGLWMTNPDGTNPQVLFGNYTEQINACYQPRAIPGTNKIVFVAGAHHAAVGGSLVVVDPSRVRLDSRTGKDDLASIEVLTPEVCFPEAPGWPASYFHSPWPLCEDCYLVAFSFEPLPGMGPGVQQDTATGIYYVDRFGNLELLYREPGVSAMYPIPLSPRPVPPLLPSALDPALGDEGELLLSDVNQSLLPMPRGVTALRVYQVLPKTETHVANRPRLGYANAESARMLLGTVPVEADGSAYFRVPAQKPLYFQAVDASGRAVQTMRSVTYLQPGERRGCVGCHERPGTAPPSRRAMAASRPPSAIAPGPDGTRPMSFSRLVQPVLDRHCVRCHDGATGPGKSPLSLVGTPAREFSTAYERLKPYVRWNEWGSASIDQAVTRPGHGGAVQSPLAAILDNAAHREVRLSEADRQRILVWLDANAPFYGAYSDAERAAQRRGESIPPPRRQ